MSCRGTMAAASHVSRLSWWCADHWSGAEADRGGRPNSVLPQFACCFHAAGEFKSLIRIGNLRQRRLFCSALGSFLSHAKNRKLVQWLAEHLAVSAARKLILLAKCDRPR